MTRDEFYEAQEKADARAIAEAFLLTDLFKKEQKEDARQIAEKLLRRGARLLAEEIYNIEEP